MTEESQDVRIQHIVGSLAFVNPGQLAVESVVHEVTGYPSWGGKDERGHITRWLAMDHAARIPALKLTGPTTTSTLGILVHDTAGNVSGGAMTADVFETYISDGPLYKEGDGISIVSHTIKNAGVWSLAIPGGSKLKNDVTLYPTDTVLITPVDSGYGFQFDAVTGEAVFLPSAITTLAGNHVGGNLDSVTTLYDDDDYHVEEVAGIPGYQIRADFTGVTAATRIRLRLKYAPSISLHIPAVKLWNYNTSAWDYFGEYSTGLTYQVLEFQIPDSGNYVSGGAAMLLIDHEQSGNATHELFLDYAALVRTNISAPVISSHDALTGRTDPDNHTQYILVSGARAFTGNQSIGGNNLTSIGTLVASSSMNLDDVYRPLSTFNSPLRVAGDASEYDDYEVAFGEVPLLAAMLQLESGIYDDSAVVYRDGTRSFTAHQSMGGNNLTSIGTLVASGSITFDDVYRPLSTLAAPFRLAADPTEYDDYEVAFGEVPLLSALSNVLLKNGTRALAGTWSLGGNDLTGANYIYGSNSVFTPGSEIYLSLDVGPEIGTTGEYYVGASAIRMADPITDSVQAWFSANTAGRSEMVGSDGTLYSEVRATYDNLFFSNPDFQGSANWTSDMVPLANSAAEVDWLYVSGTPGEKSIIAGMMAARSSLDTAYDLGTSINADAGPVFITSGADNPTLSLSHAAANRTLPLLRLSNNSVGAVAVELLGDAGVYNGTTNKYGHRIYTDKTASLMAEGMTLFGADELSVTCHSRMTGEATSSNLFSTQGVWEYLPDGGSARDGSASISANYSTVIGSVYGYTALNLSSVYAGSIPGQNSNAQIRLESYGDRTSFDAYSRIYVSSTYMDFDSITRVKNLINADFGTAAGTSNVPIAGALDLDYLDGNNQQLNSVNASITSFTFSNFPGSCSFAWRIKAIATITLSGFPASIRWHSADPDVDTFTLENGEEGVLTLIQWGGGEFSGSLTKAN